MPDFHPRDLLLFMLFAPVHLQSVENIVEGVCLFFLSLS